jgi:acetyltransferase-like isoleucine patch superfamily enzyme
MSQLARRVGAKMWSMWFAARHGASFARLGRTAFMFRPYRIDGAGSIEIGDGTSLQRGGWLYCVSADGEPARLTIGRGCDFGYQNHITCVRSVTIGDHVLTANNVHISDNSHAYEDVTRPILQQPVRFRRAVSIGSGSWIGENVCVLGASIGRNCVIGANAVVTRDIPDFCVAVGIPAVVIRRFDAARGEWIDVSGNQ